MLLALDDADGVDAGRDGTESILGSIADIDAINGGTAIIMLIRCRMSRWNWLKGCHCGARSFTRKMN